MRNFIFLVICCLSFFACSKESASADISGKYSGTFIRTSPLIFPTPTDVTLNLNNGSFSGTSSNARYPAICHGSYTNDDEEINFTNACVWTADFDWTLTLDGIYEYEIKGDRLKIWKESGEITDVYDLRKIE